MPSLLPQLTTAKGDFILGRNLAVYVDIHTAQTSAEQTSELGPDVLSHKCQHQQGCVLYFGVQDLESTCVDQECWTAHAQGDGFLNPSLNSQGSVTSTAGCVNFACSHFPSSSGKVLGLLTLATSCQIIVVYRSISLTLASLWEGRATVLWQNWRQAECHEFGGSQRRAGMLLLLWLPLYSSYLRADNAFSWV